MKSRGFPLQYFFLRTPFVNDVSKFFVDGFRGQLSRGEGITQFVIVAVGSVNYLKAFALGLSFPFGAVVNSYSKRKVESSVTPPLVTLDVDLAVTRKHKRTFWKLRNYWSILSSLPAYHMKI